MSSDQRKPSFFCSQNKDLGLLPKSTTYLIIFNVSNRLGGSWGGVTFVCCGKKLRALCVWTSLVSSSFPTTCLIAPGRTLSQCTEFLLLLTCYNRSLQSRPSILRQALGYILHPRGKLHDGSCHLPWSQTFVSPVLQWWGQWQLGEGGLLGGHLGTALSCLISHSTHGWISRGWSRMDVGICVGSQSPPWQLSWHRTGNCVRVCLKLVYEDQRSCAFVP